MQTLSTAGRPWRFVVATWALTVPLLSAFHSAKPRILPHRAYNNARPASDVRDARLEDVRNILPAHGDHNIILQKVGRPELRTVTLKLVDPTDGPGSAYGGSAAARPWCRRDGIYVLKP
jgi:hypothetical protein